MPEEGFDAAARKGVKAAGRIAAAAASLPLLAAAAGAAAVRLLPAGAAGWQTAASVLAAGAAAAAIGAAVGRSGARQVSRAFAEAAAASSPAVALPDAQRLLAGLKELAERAASVVGRENERRRKRLEEAARTADEARRLAVLLAEKLDVLAAACGETVRDGTDSE
ncbi:hypothetical protein E308F_16790 [Moorella sp. E308F]|nr:hypothetical protein E308F_16790 [Moorella sp. E308F]